MFNKTLVLNLSARKALASFEFSPRTEKAWSHFCISFFALLLFQFGKLAIQTLSIGAATFGGIGNPLMVWVIACSYFLWSLVNYQYCIRFESDKLAYERFTRYGLYNEYAFALLSDEFQKIGLQEPKLVDGQYLSDRTIIKVGVNNPNDERLNRVQNFDVDSLAYTVFHNPKTDDWIDRLLKERLNKS